MARPRKGTVVTATADQDDYGDILAMIELGEAKFLGERYDDRGVKEIAALVGDLKPNAQQIRIGREFFTTALRDYEDWREKWWREAIQNAVDAKAKEVICTVREVSTDVEVSVEDNGGGMSEEVLINKFLVLGGTTKTTGVDTTGGFGKAKELLVLPWLRWSVHTQDMLVSGSGVEYEIEKAPYLTGTRLTVVMPEDQATNAAAAQAFIGKCDIPRVKFYVNDEETKANLKPGKVIREFGDAATLYHNKRSDGFHTMLVRANGIYMFNVYVTNEIEGSLIVELNRPSIDLLTANRDGFRDSNLRYEVSSFANQLAADVKSALKAKKGLIREKFRGTGQFSSGVRSDRMEADIVETQGAVVPEGRARRMMSTEQVSMIVQVVAQSEVMDRQDEEAATNLVATADVARAMLTGLQVVGTTQMEAAARQLSWEPDFFLVNEIEGWRVPSKFKPATMATRIKQLLRFWAELCRFVLIQLSSTHRYGVGFIFSDETAASYIREDNEDWLMLNPLKPGSTKNVYSLSSSDDLNWLYAAAVHECTHIADGISYHNESFSTAFTMNIAKTAGGVKRINALKKSIVARK